MVTDNAVSGAVLFKLRSSSLKNGLLDATVGVAVTTPCCPPIVSETVVVRVRPPPVPVTVMVEVPAVAVLATVSVKVLVVLVEVGLKLADTPVGMPLALSATALLNPPVGETVMVLVPLLPAWIVRLAGAAESVKF